MGRKNRFTDIKMYFSKNYGYWSINDFKIKDSCIDLRYYLDIKPRILEKHFEFFNEKGIPLTSYGDEKQISPVNVCAYGLGNLDLYYCTNLNIYKQRALLMADWLVSNQHFLDNQAGVWYYQFDWKYMKAPWISCMAQGEAISLLSRVYMLTRDDLYLNAAEKAMKVFEISVVDGGIVSRLSEDYVFFEEYPSRDKNTFVLNGFIYSLLGLYDLYLVSDNDKAYCLFNKGVETLKHNLHRFDNNNWSYYNLDPTNKMISSYMYHNLHIVQLQILYRITGHSFFADYAIRWKGYMFSFPNRMKALVRKLKEKF